MSRNAHASGNDDDPKPSAERRFKITYKLPDGSLEEVVETYKSLDEANYQAEQKRLWHSTIVSVEEL